MEGRGGGDEHARMLQEGPVKDVTSSDGAVVVRLTGELDLYNTPRLRDALFGAAAGQPARLVVDLSDVAFMDSTALGVLVEARARLESREGFVLAAPGVETRRALEVSGLDRHFAVRDSLEDALATAPP